MKKQILNNVGLFIIMMMNMTFMACSGEDDLRDLVKNAKEKGYEWTGDEWKDGYKQFYRSLSPFFRETIALYKDLDDAKDSDGKYDEIAKKLDDKINKEYKVLIDQFQEFTEYARNTEVGNKVRKDEIFHDEQFLEASGLSEDDEEWKHRGRLDHIEHSLKGVPGW